MKKEVKVFIDNQLSILKAKTDKEVYDYIIATILKIYNHELGYAQVIDQVEENVKGITETAHQDVWSAMYSLCEVINSTSEIIKHHYEEEILEDQGGMYKKNYRGSL